MAKKIAVIFGAGASHDLIPPAQRNNMVRDNDFLPPLTEGLFNMSPHIESYLTHYPKAYTAIGNLRNRLAQKKETLEALLRELKNSPEENKQQQFRQIPLYLQYLFGQIGRSYCHHPLNYSLLINETLRSDISEVAYITLNYDLFFEDALSKETGIPFTNVNQYIPDNQKWIYVKLHGSVNWGRRISAAAMKNRGDTLGALLDNVRGLNLKTDLTEAIEVDHSYLSRPDKTDPFYPVMTIPVDDKYELNCPSAHVERLTTFLKDCKNFLMIGMSGKDRDLIDLLRNTIPDAGIMYLVGRTHVPLIKEHLRREIPQFVASGGAGWAEFDDGFSNFIISGGIDSFINSAR